MAVLDREGRVLEDTARFAGLLGSGRHLAGERLADHLHADDRARLATALGEAAAEGGTCRLRCVTVAGGSPLELTLHDRLADRAVGGIVAELRQVADVRALELKLKHAAYRDPLTGLRNRIAFLDRVRIAAAASHADALAAVMFLDLDDFKTVNDSLGHAAGDELLIGVAERLTASVRPEDLVARLGGDEFALLVDGLHGPEGAAEVAQRVLDGFEAPCPAAGFALRVMPSIGIALADPGTSEADAERLLREADMAMYAAKAQGKAGYAFFRSELAIGASHRLRLKGELSAAVVREEFEMHFQPIVECADGRVTSAEALLRWRHPSRGLLVPPDFLAVAEQSGTLERIGEWILRQAVQQAGRWRRGGHGVRVAVNVTAEQFAQPGLVDMLDALLHAERVSPRQIAIEITEQTLMRDVPQVAENLARLRRLGVRLAVDDFGTGYSSLSYLQRFPVDLLKIDKSFVSGLGEGSEAGALTRAIVEMAHCLGLVAVAEGVETEAQRRELVEMGCELAQGYHFDPPAPPDRMLALVRRPVTGGVVAAAG